MAEVWRETHECYQCRRPIIIGITSIGTPHQWIHGIVCEQCATKEDLAFPTAEELQQKEEKAKTTEEAVDEVLDEMWDDVDDALAKDMGWTPEQEKAFDKAVDELMKKKEKEE